MICCPMCGRPARGARVFMIPHVFAVWVRACPEHRTELELAA